MRTTVSIDDDLLRRLKEQAHRENVSLSSLVNRVLRDGLDAPGNGTDPPAKPRSERTYREKVFSMGIPNFDVNKALEFAAALEDDEIVRKFKMGK